MDRTIHLTDESSRSMALKLLSNLPLGALDVIIRPHKELRTISQNNLLWASANNDMAMQAWVKGKQFSADIWHEHFKQTFLPELENTDLPLLVKDVEKYIKWQEMPNGDLKCVASTTSLTKRGFSDYLEQIYALGSDLGVKFTTVQR